MYLIKAEAQFEQGNLAETADTLNATLERAGVSLVNTGANPLNKVRTERRLELAFEGRQEPRAWGQPCRFFAEKLLKKRNKVLPEIS